MDPTFIPKAIQIVKEAVMADNENRLREALVLYKKGIKYFMTGLKYEKNKSSQVAIRAKIKEYMDRAEVIKKHLEGNPQKQAVLSGGVRGGGDGKSAGGGPSSGAAGAGQGGTVGDDGKEVDEETNALMRTIESVIVMESPNIKWSDVAGLETAKKLLQEAVILPVKFPNLFQGKLKPWKGILLFGPPGTGKSHLARAVATEGQSTFMSCSSSSLLSKFQGESEKLVKNLFALARKKSPCIIFIDEVDSLVSARQDGENEASRRIKTEFLVQMDGVGGGKGKAPLVLGATNVPWELDPAIRRRFEKRVYIPLPGQQARLAIFKICIGDTRTSLREQDYAFLARETEGFSGSDISTMVKAALMQPIRTAQASTHFLKDAKTGVYTPCAPSTRGAEEMSIFELPNGKLNTLPVSLEDFRRVLMTTKPSVNPADLKKFEDWMEQYGQEG